MDCKKMRAGHIIYAVNDLEKAMKQWKEKGFKVEYARKSKKINAIIYFSTGPFIELIDMTSFPKFLLKLMSIFGGKAMVDRMNIAKKGDYNSAILCIEKDGNDLEQEIELLKKYGKKGEYLKRNRRKTPDGEVLKWKLFFPYDLSLPFLMSYYNIDPKPKNFVHPNGAKYVKSLELHTNKESIDILKQLIDDSSIKLFESKAKSEVINLEFAYE